MLIGKLVTYTVRNSVRTDLGVPSRPKPGSEFMLMPINVLKIVAPFYFAHGQLI